MGEFLKRPGNWASAGVILVAIFPFLSGYQNQIVDIIGGIAGVIGIIVGINAARSSGS